MSVAQRGFLVAEAQGKHIKTGLFGGFLKA
jgi:hypothetical protein